MEPAKEDTSQLERGKRCPTKRIMKLRNDNWVYGIGDLREIWNDCGFEDVVGDYNLQDGDVGFINDHLIRTISWLSSIRHDEMSRRVVDWIKKREKFDDKLPTIRADDKDLSWIGDDLISYMDSLRRFAAPVLVEGEEIKLEENEQMPYDEQDGKPDIFKFRIANGHLQLRNKEGTENGKVTVMRKRLPTSDQIHMEEIRMLNSLRDAIYKEKEEIRICTCICTVYSNDRSTAQCLSFFAEDGDVERKLAQIPPDCSLLEDCLRQIKGIASAIEFLHYRVQSSNPAEEDSRYCHLDLKPENIVVFPGQSKVGVWKVIDFGISKVRKPTTFTTLGTDRKPRITHTVSTSTYQLGGVFQPPEINEQNQRVMGRRSDIWSLGCILTEVLAANVRSLSSWRNQIKSRRSEDDGLFGDTDQFYYYYEKSDRLCMPVQYSKLNKAFRHGLNEIPNVDDPNNFKVLSKCTELVKSMVVVKRSHRLKSNLVVSELENILNSKAVLTS
ncbi:kinase-like protein [Hypoxylon trugodes]|uniref:kinase-like protein n=1 Tax=Hypoxylon trugodes TaxID=326681 RepID=UPI00219B65A0|nr:kinase-like protein [Hypoxylon trugodes]KAI1382646.1 kinase-like protein [Hypoxylon trugodes]